jgi:hypothetical protein
MEPDFESTPEARVARVEMRSITSSQVLARPSEWLELLRRYGNVAPFFLPVKGAPEDLQDIAVLIAYLRSRVQRCCFPVPTLLRLKQ